MATGPGNTRRELAVLAAFGVASAAVGVYRVVGGDGFGWAYVATGIVFAGVCGGLAWRERRER